MPDPVLDNQIIDWADDAATTDTNLPQGSSLMQPGGPTELAGELRVIKSVCREESVNKAWERWKGLYGTLTFIDSTHFSLTGDQRTVAQGSTTPTTPGPCEVDRRVQATLSASTLFGYISAVTFAGGLTTCTIVWDNGALDATVSEMAFGAETELNSALPEGVLTGGILYGIAAGTNTYTVTINGVTALIPGQELRINFTNANTGAATLNVNSLGAHPILKDGNIPMASGDIVAGQIMELVWDSLQNAFQVVGNVSSGIIPMGTSGVGATPIGTANIQVGNVGTPAGTAETVLFTYSLPAGALAVDGQYIIIEGRGQFANNLNEKTVRLKFGGTVVSLFNWPAATDPANTKRWWLQAIIVRTSATTQDSNGEAFCSSTGIFALSMDSRFQRAALTATLGGAVVCELTGQNGVGTALANDVAAREFRVIYGS